MAIGAGASAIVRLFMREGITILAVGILALGTLMVRGAKSADAAS